MAGYQWRERATRQIRLRDGGMFPWVVSEIPGPNHKPYEARRTHGYEGPAPGYERKQPDHQRRRQRISDVGERVHDSLREAPSASGRPGGHCTRSRGERGALTQAQARRAAMSDRNPPATPVSMVAMPSLAQQASESNAVRIYRRSNCREAGIRRREWQRPRTPVLAAYAEVEVELIRGAAVAMFTRSTNRIRYIAHSSERTIVGALICPAGLRCG